MATNRELLLKSSLSSMLKGILTTLLHIFLYFILFLFLFIYLFIFFIFILSLIFIIFFWNYILQKLLIQQCVKKVRILSFSGPYFPAFGLNTERYPVSLRIQSKCRKIWTRKTPNTNTFHAVQGCEFGDQQ